MSNILSKFLKWVRSNTQLIFAIIGAYAVFVFVLQVGRFLINLVTSKAWFQFDIVLSLIMIISASAIVYLLQERNKISRIQTMLLREAISKLNPEQTFTKSFQQNPEITSYQNPVKQSATSIPAVQVSKPVSISKTTSSLKSKSKLISKSKSNSKAKVSVKSGSNKLS